MKHLKHVTLLIVMAMVLVGCSTMKVNLVDPAGRKMPDPHYVLSTVGYPITILFYYAAFEGAVDLDGSFVGSPRYVDFMKEHEFYASKVKAVVLTIEVNNPTGLEYSLYHKLNLRIKKDSINTKEVQAGGEVNRSNLKYRQFVYQLPYGKKIRNVDSLVIFSVEKNEVARIGNFRYNLIN